MKKIINRVSEPGVRLTMQRHQCAPPPPPPSSSSSHLWKKLIYFNLNFGHGYRHLSPLCAAAAAAAAAAAVAAAVQNRDWNLAGIEG